MRPVKRGECWGNPDPGSGTRQRTRQQKQSSVQGFEARQLWARLDGNTRPVEVGSETAEELERKVREAFGLKDGERV